MDLKTFILQTIARLRAQNPELIIAYFAKRIPDLKIRTVDGWVKKKQFPFAAAEAVFDNEFTEEEATIQAPPAGGMANLDYRDSALQQPPIESEPEPEEGYEAPDGSTIVEGVPGTAAYPIRNMRTGQPVSLQQPLPGRSDMRIVPGRRSVDESPNRIVELLSELSMVTGHDLTPLQDALLHTNPSGVRPAPPPRTVPAPVARPRNPIPPQQGQPRPRIVQRGWNQPAPIPHQQPPR